jgi:hypothetical protein
MAASVKVRVQRMCDLNGAKREMWMERKMWM